MSWVISSDDGAACTGTPTPGNTISTTPSACSGVSFSLSLQNSTPGSGVTYQWQSGPSGTGPWTNISGATSSTLNTSNSATTWYQCNVTCSGNTGTSNPVQVMSTPPSGCYCAAGATSTGFEKISRVQFNTIDNPSTSTAGYENFTAISTTVIKGQVIPITVTISTPDLPDQVLVWIDFNQNGSFSDPGEQVYTSALGVGPHTGSITISTTALTGPTRMRIRMHDSSLGPNSAPCGNSTYGQVEDYTVNIQPCVVGNITTQPANRSVQCSGTTTFTVATSGSAITYLWQVNDNSPLDWQNLVNGGVYSGATTNTLTLTNVPATMSGYRYRVIYQGPCTGTRFSNEATLTVTSLIATVNPASATICTGSIQQLTLSNVSNPATTTYSSGPISIQIPDAIGPPASSPAVCNAGISHSINVPLAAGTVISRIDVKLNITHSYVGDLVIVLKAPNGAILNLDYHKGLTGTSGANFINTIFSSTGTLGVNTGTSPGYTGLWRADAVLVPVSVQGLPPSPTGPTGFAATTTSWNALYPNPGGNWTIAMMDPEDWGGDIGTLTSWSMDITYGGTATGTWTSNPATPNTMFTDAAATVPYPGGQAITIYVKPTVNTVYSVVYSTATPCTSAPTNIPVNVVNPITAIVNPTDKSVCAGGNTSFNVGATGGPIAYQWMVSTDGGANYSNISGSNSATLNLSNVTQSMNNNRYRVRLSAAPCTGTTTTPFALLTVNPLPAVTITAAPISALRPQLTTTITAASTPRDSTYTWSLNGTLLSNITKSILVNVDGIGTYTVTVMDVNRCVNTSSPLTITGLFDNRLYISPNPAPNGQFQIRAYSGVNFDYRTISIYNTSGQRVYRKPMATTGPWQKVDVNLAGVTGGVYIVVVSDGYDTKRVVGKVVIQR